ncbi:cell wall binding repeat-containing protein, partial [Enterobacter ludwigii]
EGIRNKCNTDISGSGWGKNEFLKNYSNVTIRNNYLENVVGDGIVLTETKGGLIEGNMVNSSCGFDRGAVNYTQCWTMFADDVTVQYNEVYGNRYGYDDGEAFDSDMMNVDNIFQYNLSHDCGGGVMLFMSSQKNTIFRYNISINDGTGTYPGESRMQQQTFHYDNTSSAGPGVGKIYNNTIVVFGEDKKTSLFGGMSKRTCFVDFKNNIVLA